MNGKRKNVKSVTKRKKHTMTAMKFTFPVKRIRQRKAKNKIRVKLVRFQAMVIHLRRILRRMVMTKEYK